MLDDILSLPGDISGQLLSNWLDIEDIGKLDSATCNTTNRGSFLQLLASEFVIHPNQYQDIDIHSGLFLNWLSLRQLKLISIALSDAFGDFHLIPPDWSQLQTLEFNLNFESKLWSMSESFAALFINCPKLEVMDLGPCYLLEESLGKILQGAPHLKHLNIIDRDSPRSNSVIAEYCHELTGLKLSSDALDGKILGEIAQSNRNLQTLSLYDCKLLVNASLEEHAIMHLRNLRCIELDALREDETILLFAKHCPQLESISLNTDYSVHDATVAQLAKLCPNLKRLSLECVWNITNNGLRSIGEHCSKLEFLRIFGNRHVTDEGIATLTKGCSKLHTVELRSLPLITDRSILSIAENCSATLITLLLVNNCRAMSVSQALTHILQHDCVKNMTLLDFAGCPSDEACSAVREIVQRCTRLMHIVLDSSLSIEKEINEIQSTNENVQFSFLDEIEFLEVDVHPNDYDIDEEEEEEEVDSEEEESEEEEEDGLQDWTDYGGHDGRGASADEYEENYDSDEGVFWHDYQG